MLTEFEKMKIQTVHMLFEMYNAKYTKPITDKNTVHKFYDDIVFSYLSEDLLVNFNVTNESDLMSLFAGYNAYLEKYITEEEFVKKLKKEN